MTDDIVIVACDSVDAITENVPATLTDNGQWIFKLPLSFAELEKKLISKIPTEFFSLVTKVILSSAAQDAYAKDQTFIEEKIKGKRRVKPTVALDAMGVNSVNLFVNSFTNVRDIVGIDAACATGLKAMEIASLQALSGDIVFVATADVPTAPYFLYYFNSLGALASGEQYKGPFDSDRNGFAMADAAAFVILCKRSVAELHHLPIIGSIRALASRVLPSTVTPSDTTKLVEFIHQTLDTSGVPLQDLSHWDAHATATPVGDQVEYQIFNSLMHVNVPMTSIKGHVGHSMASCGLVELTHSIKNLQDGVVKANGSLYNKMIEDDRIIDKDITTGKRSFIKTSFGFGGRNSAIILTVE